MAKKCQKKKYETVVEISKNKENRGFAIMITKKLLLFTVISRKRTESLCLHIRFWLFSRNWLWKLFIPS